MKRNRYLLRQFQSTRAKDEAVPRRPISNWDISRGGVKERGGVGRRAGDRALGWGATTKPFDTAFNASIHSSLPPMSDAPYERLPLCPCLSLSLSVRALSILHVLLDFQLSPCPGGLLPLLLLKLDRQRSPRFIEMV